MSYNLLKGKKGIIFGALDNKSIAWKIAVRAHEEGAVFTSPSMRKKKGVTKGSLNKKEQANIMNACSH